MLYMLAGSRATTVRIRKKLGKQSIMSTNLMINVSMEIVPTKKNLTHFNSGRFLNTFFDQMKKNMHACPIKSSTTPKVLGPTTNNPPPINRMMEARI
jgi:hypothetical protein